MKLVEVIQKVEFLPGQRLATSPAAKPVGGRRRTSGAGRSKPVGPVLSLESGSKVVVPKGISGGGSPDPWHANADSFILLERSILLGAKASLTRDHRGRRPGHVGTRIARELGRASPLPVYESAEHGSPPRDQSSRRKDLPLRRVDPSYASNAETTGREGRAE